MRFSSGRAYWVSGVVASVFRLQSRQQGDAEADGNGIAFVNATLQCHLLRVLDTLDDETHAIRPDTNIQLSDYLSGHFYAKSRNETVGKEKSGIYGQPIVHRSQLQGCLGLRVSSGYPT